MARILQVLDKAQKGVLRLGLYNFETSNGSKIEGELPSDFSKVVFCVDKLLKGKKAKWKIISSNTSFEDIYDEFTVAQNLYKNCECIGLATDDDKSNFQELSLLTSAFIDSEIRHLLKNKGRDSDRLIGYGLNTNGERYKIEQQ